MSRQLVLFEITQNFKKKLFEIIWEHKVTRVLFKKES
jgi:hypothetical protein